MTAAEPEEEVPEKVPVPEPVPKEEKDDTPMSAMSVDQFMDVLKKKGMAPIKRSASAFPRGQSPYTLAIHVCCKYPDITSNDLFKNFKKETGFEGEIGSHERRTIQTAHSYVRKIVRFLREYDHMPDKSTAPVKKPTTRKPTPKKNKA